jgi:GT2 family glycosyltransferase
MMPLIKGSPGLVARNKGVARARGQIIGLLNSDDIYEPDIFAAVLQAFEMHPEVDIVSGEATHFEDRDQGRLIRGIFPAVTPANIAQRLMKGVPIINAWFFRRRVFEQIGLFDLGFPIAADRDFQIRCWLNNFKIHPIERFFYHYRNHQGSLTVNGDLAKQEGYLNDMLHLAEKYIDMDLGNPGIKRKFVEWQDLTVFELFISNMRRGNFRKSLAIVISAVRKKPSWLFVFMLQIPVRAIGYSYRRINEILHPQNYGYLLTHRIQ